MKLQLGASLLSPSITKYLLSKYIVTIVAEVGVEVKGRSGNCGKWTKTEGFVGIYAHYFGANAVWKGSSFAFAASIAQIDKKEGLQFGKNAPFTRKALGAIMRKNNQGGIR